MKRLITSFALGLVLVGFVSLASAQSLTTGAISGMVVDQSGAVMASVVVTAKNVDTGATRETQTTGSGNFLLAQLDPGRYEVTAESAGFEKTKIGPITVVVSRVASLEFKLKIGSSTETVEVKRDAPLVEPSNPNTTTTFSATQIGALPNPGLDLTYLANLAPGAIINTSSANAQFGAGNVQVNGLPSTANNFTIDGLDATDPFTNENLTGASGLQLGLNSIEEVSVNTVSYSLDQGRLAAAQINYITKSGTNNFHGNAYEIWNGAAMNARNFFFNSNPAKPAKPRSNVNQFGASIGGPLRKDKLFFFADLEGIRLVLPVTLSSSLPSPAYQSYVLQQLPQGGADSVQGGTLPPEPQEVPFYQNMFKLMGDTSQGVPLATLGCPFDVGGGQPAIPNTGNGCVNQRLFSASPAADETLFTFKVDYHARANESFWLRFQLNNGMQTSVDPVNQLFNQVTSVPIRSAAAGWTHVFTPNLVNQFNPGFFYRSAVPDVADPTKRNATFPIVYSVTPPFSPIGGNGAFLPLGVVSTVWDLNDTLAWNFGKHGLKFGGNLQRPLSDPVNGSFVVPFVFGCSLPEFTFGATCSNSQALVKSVKDRIASVNLDTYAMDTYKVTSKLTVTVGLRMGWYSDPVSRHDAFSRLNGTFATISHDVNRPLNLDILANQVKLYSSTPLLKWEPRTAIAYQAVRNTVFRAGFGIFGQSLETLPSSNVNQNPPSTVTVKGGLFGTAGGIGIAPGVPNSAIDAAVAADQRFQNNFASGALSCASPQASAANCIPAINFVDYVPDSSGRKGYPYVIQSSAAVEQQLGTSFDLTIGYVGTRSVKTLYTDSPNGFQRFCSGCFSPFPFGSSPDPRFLTVASIHTGANSSYHALEVTAKKRVTHGLTAQMNYTYSHCIDTRSNGGGLFFNVNSSSQPAPGQLSRFRGNCDYDIRHSLNGSYLYELPVHSGKHWLNGVIGNWQVSGTVFVRGGFPFSVYSASVPSRFRNVAPTLFPNPVAGQDPYAGSAIPGVTQPGTIQWLNPNAFQSVLDKSTNGCFPTTDVQHCQDGSLGRNALRGPGFTWLDLDLAKRFMLNERVSFKFDVQAYNLFNHPNFAIPNTGVPRAGIPSKLSTLVGFGTISATVAPTTSLLGGRLGADTSVRMIALRGVFQF